ETGGAESTMGNADCADTFRRRLIVEQYPAAAVHLAVDEAGQQHLPRQVVYLRAGWNVVRCYQCENPRVFHDHGNVVSPSLGGKDACIGQRLRHQTVSVTL